MVIGDLLKDLIQQEVTVAVSDWICKKFSRKQKVHVVSEELTRKRSRRRKRVKK